jgi:phytoene dehydrogenase-like protein
MIAIIGAGVAGLSAGCYAQMNGYDSSIYEMHGIPGGLCTSWKRGDFTFDGCIDWLTGSAPDGMMHPLWQELGVIQNNTFIYEDEYCRYSDKDGGEIALELNIDALEMQLKQYAPEDQKTVDELCAVIRRFKGFKPPVEKAVETMGFTDYGGFMADLLRHIGQYRCFFKYGKISMGEFAQKFSNPTLRDMFSSIWDRKIPMSLFAATMAWCSDRTAGYPEGGSLKLARDIERRYSDLGGSVHYGKRVEKIIVRDGKATGLVLAKGEEIASDIIISAGDIHSAVNNLLDGSLVPERLNSWFREMPTFPPYIQISLGVNRNMGTEPRLRYWHMNKPLMIAGHAATHMIVHNYSFDKTLAPAGKTPLVVRFFTNFDYWHNLAEDRNAYLSEKNMLADKVIGRLEDRYPGIRKDIGIIDVATPVTYVRYTGTWRGATMSWLPTSSNFAKTLPKMLPGLESFYMAGQWLVPGGGIPNAAKTGRDVIQIVCRKHRKAFRTSVPGT